MHRHWPFVILDIDGCLVELVPIPEDRDFEWSEIHDASNRLYPVSGMVNLACHLFENRVGIVIVTGRMEVNRPDTLNWLIRHGIPFNDLLMRPLGDERSGPAVKADLFRNSPYCRAPWRCMFAVDDDPAICAMWDNEFQIPTVRVAHFGG